MTPDWELKSRSEACTATGRAFVEGDTFYTLLIRDKGGFRREDLSEEAWAARNDNIQPFSFWRSKFEPPAPPAPETLAKETAEDLLRNYMASGDPGHANARYILALMLERKRLLKQTAVEKTADGITRIYEHGKSGDIFVIPDPGLHLDEIEAVQNEVVALLG